MLGWELPPHNSGGLGVACYHLSKALADEGVSIDFVVPYSAPHDDIDFMNVRSATKYSPLHKFGMGAYSTDMAAFSSKNKESSSKAPGNIRDIQKQYTSYIEKLAETETYDAIHAHDWLTAEAGIRAKELFDIPLVIHVHATEFDRAGGSAGNPIIHEIEYQGLIMADRIVAVSDITKRIIVDKYNIPEDKVDVVYNAIDTTSFDDNYVYDQRTYKYLEHLKANDYTVLSAITRFTVQKGLTFLMEAFAKATTKHEKLALLLAGDGEQRDELIRLAAKYGVSDRVFFTGFVRGKQWRDAYSVSDIFVMSSVSEPFGLTALEAAHHSNALIMTNQSGVSEVLNSIFTYDFWDTDKLANQIVGVAKSEALQKSLKDNITHEYTKISWIDIARKCIHNYKAPSMAATEGIYA